MQGHDEVAERDRPGAAADYLVEGSVRTEDNRLRLTSKLTRVSDQALVWSQSYDRELTTVLGLQFEVSAAIAEQIRFRISTETRASIERRQTRSADAYDAYMHGRTLSDQANPRRLSARSITTGEQLRWIPTTRSPGRALRMRSQRARSTAMRIRSGTRIGRIPGSQPSWSGTGSCGVESEEVAALTIAALASDIWLVEFK